LQRILRLKNLPDAIGLNSRDLKTFRIQPDQPLRLKAHIPKNIPAVYESGVDSNYLLEIIGNAGFRAALIGEAAVRAVKRAQTVRNFVSALRRGAKQKPNFFTKLYAAKKNTYVKICGLTSAADVRLAAKAGADIAGFVFVPESPRCADEKLLHEVKDVKILKAAVVKKVTPQIKKLLRAGLLDAAQTYNEADVCALAGQTYLITTDTRRRALPVTLYDAPKTRSMRRGQRISAREHQRIYGQWLAGGLTPQNVLGLIKKVQPGLVDVSSGVEKSVGQKDARKIKLFLKEVKRA
jgi:phosphoribosylanthranilate isomerase